MSVQTTYSQDMTIGVSGQLADSGANDCFAGYNAESSAAIDFGLGVKFEDTSDPVDGMKLPASESDAIQGITVRSHAYSEAMLDSDGKPIVGSPLTMLRKGRVLVQCDSGCAKGDRLWVRAVATGSERLGAPENADDGTDTVDCTKQGVWITPAAAGALAVLEVDFTNEPD